MSTSRQMSCQACAACKHQRRKCPLNCVLARYFPPERSQQFVDVHRFFGVSNLMKLCNSVAPEHHDAFMETIIYEAEMRRKDPVRGCLGVVCDLSAQIFCMMKEIEAIQQEIMFCKNHEGRAVLMNQQRQFDGIQLQQPPPPMLFNPVPGNGAGKGSSSNLPGPHVDDLLSFDRAHDLNVSDLPQF